MNRYNIFSPNRDSTNLSTEVYLFLGRTCGQLIFMVGLLALLGWALDISILKSGRADWATMKVNTAIGFLLLGMVLNMLAPRANFLFAPAQHTAVILLATLIFLIGCLTLFQYISGWNLGIDQFLTRDLTTPPAAFPGRMSEATALCFILASTAILLKQKQLGSWAHFVITILAFTALIALVGYSYDVTSLYAVEPFNSIAIHTVLSFLTFCGGLFFVTYDKGIMKVIASQTHAGHVIRILVPVATITPPLLGFLILKAEQNGRFDNAFALVLLVSSIVFVLLITTYISTTYIYQLEKQSSQITEALKETETKYRNIFENAAEGIFQALPNGRIFTANPSFAKMLGYPSPRALVNASTYFNQTLFVQPDRYQTYRDKLQQTSKIRGFEAQLSCLDQRKIWVVINVRQIFSPDSQLLYYEGTISNITQQKQLETQLHQAQKMEAIGRLAGGIAHDFNNILTVIIGYSDLALHKLTNDHPVYKRIKEVYKAGQRAAALTKQLLAFSRNQVIERKIIDLNQVVQQLIGMLERLIGSNIQLETILTNKSTRINADQGQIEQIIMNLIINARDAMPTGGQIIIETGQVIVDEAYASHKIDLEPGRYVVLAIADTGMGMDEETQAQIFEPFFTTKDTHKGTGLGLSIVYGVVKQHGGIINVYSELEQGTVFRIYLPFTTKPLSNGNDQPLLSDQPKPQAKILVIDDSAPIRKLVTQTLQNAGYQVNAVKNGDEALDFCRAYDGSFDLVISDVIMPGINITELTKQLKKLYPEVKFLYMSGYTGHTVAHQHALAAGNHFLPKPFNIATLMQSLNAALNSPPANTLSNADDEA